MKNSSVRSKLFMPLVAAMFAAGAAFATNQHPAASEKNLATFWEEQGASSCSELECSEDNSGIACKQSYEIHSNASCNQVANVSALRRP
jgi:hypothetical protein